jgi:hypothetical protein
LAGGPICQPGKLRLAVDEDVDLRRAGGGMDDPHGGIRFRRVLLGPHGAIADWEEPGHEGEAQQGDPKDS